MFREFAILLCAGIFICGSASDFKDQNASAESPYSDIVAPPGDHLALPSDASYQEVAPPPSNYLPTSGQQYAYEVKPAVVNKVSIVKSIDVPVQSYGSAIANQQTATYSASAPSESLYPKYSNIGYVPTVQPINPYYTVPVAAKTVPVGSSGAFNAQGPIIHSSHGQNAAVYTSNAGPARPFSPIPVVASNTVVESNRAVNIHPPSGYGTQNTISAVPYFTNSAAQNQYYAVPLSANTATGQSQGVTAHSPAVATYQVNQVQAINSVPHNVHAQTPAQSVTYNINPVVKSVPVSAVPVASKSVAIESYNSVTAHPPTAPRYATGPALIKYAPVQVPVKPIPVPVLYPSVETHHSSVQQFAVAPTAATYGQQQVNSGQLIPVPVISSGAGVNYHSVSVVPNVAQQKGYAKSVVFSPASEVSRVTFNGLGVTYGW